MKQLLGLRLISDNGNGREPLIKAEKALISDNKKAKG
jgi:hypothetical protein